MLRRNLKAIDRLLDNSNALPLARRSRRMYKNLLVCCEAHRQQWHMYEDNSRRIDDRANRAYGKARDIRMSGSPKGRPPKHVSRADKKQTAADERVRNHVEVKFGQGKRRFGLARTMARLADTSAAQISLSFLVMNHELALKRFFFFVRFDLLPHGQTDSCTLSRLLTATQSRTTTAEDRLRDGRPSIELAESQSDAPNQQALS